MERFIERYLFGFVSHAELGMVTLKYLVKKKEHFKCGVKRDEERVGI